MDGRSNPPSRTYEAIELAEALSDLRETELVRLLLRCDPSVTDALRGALAAAGGRVVPLPPHHPAAGRRRLEPVPRPS